MMRTVSIFRRVTLAAGALALSLTVFAAGEVGPKNPAPASKLQGYAGYEIKPVTLAADEADKKNVDKVVAKVEENIQQSVGPILKDWNASAAAATNKSTILIEPAIVSVHKPSGANRFFAGAMAGNSHIVMKVKITEQPSGKVIAEPEFYRRANARLRPPGS